MTRQFEATAQTSERMDSIGQLVLDFAFAQADEFIGCGQSPREATSIVTNLMLRAAWIVAGCGAEAEGVEPDPNKFRDCVEAALDSITWESDEEAK